MRSLRAGNDKALSDSITSYPPTPRKPGIFTWYCALSGVGEAIHAFMHETESEEERSPDKIKDKPQSSPAVRAPIASNDVDNKPVTDSAPMTLQDIASQPHHLDTDVPPSRIPRLSMSQSSINKSPNKRPIELDIITPSKIPMSNVMAQSMSGSATKRPSTASVGQASSPRTQSRPTTAPASSQVHRAASPKNETDSGTSELRRQLSEMSLVCRNDVKCYNRKLRGGNH